MPGVNFVRTNALRPHVGQQSCLRFFSKQRPAKQFHYSRARATLGPLLHPDFEIKNTYSAATTSFGPRQASIAFGLEMERQQSQVMNSGVK